MVNLGLSAGARRRRLLASGGLALLILGALVLAPLVVHDVGQPCPPGVQTERPAAVHLTPSLFKHRSVVQVPSADVTLNMPLVACVDDRVVGEGIADEEDLASELTTINVATHWVNWMWLSGRLGELQRPERWVVVLGPF